jgi:hypothetical protein
MQNLTLVTVAVAVVLCDDVAIMLYHMWYRMM